MLKKKNRFCHLNISDTRSACWRQRHVDRLLSALIKGQLFFGTMAAEAKVRAAQYGLGGWRVASAVNSGQQWGRINRVSCKGVCVCMCVCVPLGGAGVEGGAWPMDGRVVLTYWWSLSRSNFLFTWGDKRWQRRKQCQKTTIIISHVTTRMYLRGGTDEK